MGSPESIKPKFQCVVCDGIETVEDWKGMTVDQIKMTIKVMKLCKQHEELAVDMVMQKL